MERCGFCGTVIPRGLQGCPACDGAGESLPALDLGDDELGLRAEDRFVYLPGVETGIRRRVHDESLAGPIAILVGLILFFLLAAWLGGT